MKRHRMILGRGAFAAILAALLLGVVTSIAPAAGSRASAPANEQGATETVRIAVGPYLDILGWVLADRIGLDEEQGLDFKITTLPNQGVIVSSLTRGDIDVGFACVACFLPLVKQAPKTTDWMTYNDFKGFVIVGRSGSPTFAKLSASVGRNAAKKQIIENFRGKTFVTVGLFFQGLLESMLKQEGMSLKDVKIVDFADEGKSGIAFLRGEGDYYLGGLPTTSKLLQSSNKFVAVGGQDVLGPGGLWYTDLITTSDWLASNPDTAMKLMAIIYRANRYVQQRPTEAFTILREELNKRAATNFSLPRVTFLGTQMMKFIGLDDLKKQVYNPSNQRFWKNGVDHYVSALRKDLGANFKTTTTFKNDVYYRRFLQNRELVAWVNQPFS